LRSGLASAISGLHANPAALSSNVKLADAGLRRADAEPDRGHYLRCDGDGAVRKVVGIGV